MAKNLKKCLNAIQSVYAINQVRRKHRAQNNEVYGSDSLYKGAHNNNNNWCITFLYAQKTYHKLYCLSGRRDILKLQKKVLR